MLTPRQKQILESFLDTGTKQAVADKLGISRSAVRNALTAIEKKGLAPWLESVPLPPTMAMTNTTVHYRNGEVIQEWRRLSPSIQQMGDIVEALCEQVKGKGRAPVRKPKKTDSEDVLFEIDIFDAHVGMYADEKETLDHSYNCDIAAKAMVDVAERLAARATRPKKCVLVFGGDMIHSDNRSNRTEQSGNALDVDGRYHRVIEYIIKACRDVVQICASVAEEVEIVVLQGNHSWHSEAWLAHVLDAYYSTCPNIKVLMSRSPRKKIVFGNNLLVWAHGDKIASNKWAMIIAAEFAEDWGKTKFRHLKTGHKHHKYTIAPTMVDEQSGLLVEILEALCATDSYHANAGYVGSQKGASAFEYHRKHGLMTRYFTPSFWD
jgi:hypothetical protein